MMEWQQQNKKLMYRNIPNKKFVFYAVIEHSTYQYVISLVQDRHKRVM
ncbi:hypothetical protein HMPREF0663_12268 [Hoylesella oralis ATCC 33269]|uniref:Uncharacterized protein n=1 Tax=Hoylesella oralis ATCC 33269 TaxID=873533 RepID=E7RSK0_9BACT|nr:hypothetical protein HMPREF0663_12268 [Hoylesella oralis ATCC 33269]EPH19332.1 hypothetical protein HMPREF1475_00222 [Hoylesella oralis HGA0225]SHG02087.1 hypothetical protein SAMN05444288_2136 [Hoylesella oralis]